jgi:hypothetical protein
VTGASSLLQVLVVEDDLGDLALVESAFADHSVSSTLHHVSDGVEALAFLRRDEPYRDVPRPDLILLDLNMPRVDGRQGAHANAFVTKPINLDDYERVVIAIRNFFGHTAVLPTRPSDGTPA